MKSLIKQLEVMGQTKSIKQHQSVKQLIESGEFDSNLIDEVSKFSSELICAVEPQDDQE